MNKHVGYNDKLNHDLIQDMINIYPHYSTLTYKNKINFKKIN